MNSSSLLRLTSGRELREHARVNPRQVCLVGLVVAVAGAMSAGCADTIFVGYQPQWWGPRIADGNRLTVKVVVHDARNDPTRVGMKKTFAWMGLLGTLLGSGPIG